MSSHIFTRTVFVAFRLHAKLTTLHLNIPTSKSGKALYGLRIMVISGVPFTRILSVTMEPKVYEPDPGFPPSWKTVP